MSRLVNSLLAPLRIIARPLFGRGYWGAPGLRRISAWYRRSFRPDHILLEGIPFYLNYQDGWFSSYVAVHGYWERTETEAIRRCVRPGMRVLDLGANIGYYTVVLSRAVGANGHVVAFEPEPACFDLLVKNTSALPDANVELIKAAAWERSGDIEFFTNPDDHLDHSAVPVRGWESAFSVHAIAIDDLVGDDGWFDFIKMDIQGGEGRALKGMERLLRRKLPEAIVTEFWPTALEKAGTPPAEVFQQLLDLGYEIEVISEEERSITPVTYEQIVEQSRDRDYKFFNLLCRLPQR